MICKWCGNKLSPTNTKCKRCGKEVPALSDCGGFYDLVPNAPKPVDGYSVSGRSSSGPGASVHRSEQQSKKEAAKRKAGVRKAILGLAILMAIGFIFILIMQFALQNEVKSISRKVDDLSIMIDDLWDEILTEIESIATEETEPSEETQSSEDSQPPEDSQSSEESQSSEVSQATDSSQAPEAPPSTDAFPPTQASQEGLF